MQRIFGVDVSPGGSPLLSGALSDSVRSLQSSPRSAFTAVGASLQVQRPYPCCRTSAVSSYVHFAQVAVASRIELGGDCALSDIQGDKCFAHRRNAFLTSQSARRSSISNVRAELARLLPGLSPFTALAEPAHQGLAAAQGLAAQHSIVAGGRQGSGPGSAQGLAQQGLAALQQHHQQQLPREQQHQHQQQQSQGLAGAGNLVGAGGAVSPADALAAFQHASDRVRALATRRTSLIFL